MMMTAAGAAEKEVWYDASGKVFKLTKAQRERNVYVPDWKKREQERLTRMEALRIDQSASSRTSNTHYWDPYAVYDSGYHSPYNHGWSCHPRYYWNRHPYRHHGFHGYGRSHKAFRLQGVYQKNGWSVRLRY